MREGTRARTRLRMRECWQVKKAGMRSLAEVSEEQLEMYLKGLFALGDENGDGVLSKEELTKLLGMSGFSFSASAIEELITSCDKNGDGVIDFAEFIGMAHVLRGQTPKVPPLAR